LSSGDRGEERLDLLPDLGALEAVGAGDDSAGVKELVEVEGFALVAGIFNGNEFAIAGEQGVKVHPIAPLG
jgi:hypothetical protein